MIEPFSRNNIVTVIPIIKIDKYIYAMDKILSKYISIPEGILFVANRRGPLNNESLIKYLMKCKVSLYNTPQLPYWGAELFSAIVEYAAYNVSSYRELFNKNIFLNKDSEPIYINYTGCNDIKELLTQFLIIFKVLDDDNYSHVENIISREDIDELLMCLDILEKITVELIESNGIDNIYSLDISNSIINLVVHQDVLTYRYQEFMENSSNKDRSEMEIATDKYERSIKPYIEEYNINR